MTEQQKQQRITALSQCGGVCEVCGKPLGAHAQAAHRIANTEPNRRKWGAWIIDSPLNVGYTCSLECNQCDEDIIYCEQKEKTFSKEYACRLNKCKFYSCIGFDVFNPEKTYKPRDKKQNQDKNLMFNF